MLLKSQHIGDDSLLSAAAALQSLPNLIEFYCSLGIGFNNMGISLYRVSVLFMFLSTVAVTGFSRESKLSKI